MYEYVALFWKGCHPPSDEAFITERGGLLDLGWEEVVRASWHRRPPYGGACIMRRPKDESRKGWTERRELQRRNEELQGRLSQYEERICALTDRIVRLEKAIAEAIAILGRLAFSEMPKEETNG